MKEIVCVQNETVVTNAFKGERLNKYVPIFEKYQDTDPVQLQRIRHKLGSLSPKGEMRVLNKIFPGRHQDPGVFHRQEHCASAHSEVPHIHRNHRVDEERFWRAAHVKDVTTHIR